MPKLFTWTFCLFFSFCVQAQSIKYDYTKQINKLLGNTYRLDALSEAQLLELGKAYYARATLWRDLANLQAVVGRTYHTYRDTARGAAPSVYNRYFLGRYRFVCGDYAPALQAFRSCAENIQLAQPYRSLSHAWAGACAFRLQKMDEAKSWWKETQIRTDSRVIAETIYLQYALGAGTETSISLSDSRSIANSRLLLWSALRQGRLRDCQRLTDQLCREIPPDHKQDIKGLYTLQFYDPMTLMILADADYFLAGDAFSRITSSANKSKAALGAATSALESGNLVKARELFASIHAAYSPIYNGVLAALDDKNHEAQTEWAKITSSTNTALLIEWIRWAARFPGQTPTVQRIYQENFATTSNQEQALILGRAFLQNHTPETACAIMTKAYRADSHNKLDEMNPSFLVVLSHAKYLFSRLLERDALGHLAAVAKTFPAAASTLELMQLATVPENPEIDDNSRTGK